MADLIGKILRKYRKEKGVSQRVVAEIIGVKSAQMSKYEEGFSQLDTKKLMLLCEYYKVTPNDLLLERNKLAHGLTAEEDTVSYELQKESDLQKIKIEHLEKQLLNSDREINGNRQHIELLQSNKVDLEKKLAIYKEQFEKLGKEIEDL